MITVKGNSEHGTSETETSEARTPENKINTDRSRKKPIRLVDTMRSAVVACVATMLLMLMPVNSASAAAAKSTISITKLPVLGVNELQQSNMLFKTGLNKQQSTIQFRETGQSVPFRLKAAIQKNAASIDPRSVGYSVFWEDAISPSPIQINQQTSSMVLQTDHPSAADEGVISLIKNNRKNRRQIGADSVDVLVLTFIIE